jgi:Ca2+:H+ antiporter
MLSVSFLVGGLKRHVQHYNRNSAHLQAGLLFLATIAILIPPVESDAESPAATTMSIRC